MKCVITPAIPDAKPPDIKPNIIETLIMITELKESITPLLETSNRVEIRTEMRMANISNAKLILNDK